MTRLALILGPMLFPWPAKKLHDFYGRMADEAEYERVHSVENAGQPNLHRSRCDANGSDE